MGKNNIDRKHWNFGEGSILMRGGQDFLLSPHYKI